MCVAFNMAHAAAYKYLRELLDTLPTCAHIQYTDHITISITDIPRT